MKRKTKKKTVNYKQVVFAGGEHDLQKLLAEALKTHNEAKLRSYPVSTEIRRLLNNSTTRLKCFVGELIQFEKGKDQLLLTIEDGTEVMELNTEDVTPDDKGRIREIVEGSLLFVIRKNHVGIVASQTLVWSSLEKYLNWFLIEKTGALGDDNYISLQDVESKGARKKLKESTIKSVIFGEGLDASAPVEKDKLYQIKSRSKTAGAISAIFGESWNTSASLKDLSLPKHLNVRIEVSYNRDSEEDDQKVLRTLAQTNLGESMEIILDNKTRIKGDEMQVKGTVAVEEINGIISAEEYFNTLPRWLSDKFSNKEIS